jgi:hypothetical protein
MSRRNTSDDVVEQEAEQADAPIADPNASFPELAPLSHHYILDFGIARGQSIYRASKLVELAELRLAEARQEYGIQMAVANRDKATGAIDDYPS